MRVAFLTHRLPYAPNKGDRLRAYHMLRAMRASVEVDLVLPDPRHRPPQAASAGRKP